MYEKQTYKENLTNIEMYEKRTYKGTRQKKAIQKQPNGRRGTDPFASSALTWNAATRTLTPTPMKTRLR